MQQIKTGAAGLFVPTAPAEIRGSAAGFAAVWAGGAAARAVAPAVRAAVAEDIPHRQDEQHPHDG